MSEAQLIVVDGSTVEVRSPTGVLAYAVRVNVDELKALRDDPAGTEATSGHHPPRVVGRPGPVGSRLDPTSSTSTVPCLSAAS